jgi:rhamnose transport system ATP-binding protein
MSHDDPEVGRPRAANVPAGSGAAMMMEPEPAREPVVSLRGISKHYGGVYAVRGVDLDLHAGEVHALLGENGAGKSTLVKVLGGIHRPTEGSMVLDGAVVDFHSPAQSQALGISVVHQEPALFPDLDIAENIYQGRYPRRGPRAISWRDVYANAAQHLADLGVQLDVRAKIDSLSVAERQIVEIAKALSLNARVLVLDEPTAALSAGEVEDFFRIVRALRARGVAILFVSHRLEEIQSLADRVTVLRDAALTITAPAATLNREQLIRHMVGRRLDDLFPKEEAEIGEPVLTVRKLCRAGVFQDVSFEVRRGEIVGLCGLVGAGRTEVARVIFGIDHADAGTVAIRGVDVSIDSPTTAMRHGIAYLPEDRHGQGLVLDWNVTTNTTLAVLRSVTPHGLIKRGKEKRLAEGYVKDLAVRCQSVAQKVLNLSGGNQQKVVLAKWLATNPAVLILDEPTRGVDIGTKAEVHRLISGLAQRGMAILMISSELPEIIGMSDRVIVLHEGRVTGEFLRAEADQETLMAAATGQVTSDR